MYRDLQYAIGVVPKPKHRCAVSTQQNRLVRSELALRPIAAMFGLESRSGLLEEEDQILNLVRSQTDAEADIVEVHDVLQCLGRAVVEVRRA
jgi:hypothetical protein